jgi:hypothetical protein
VFIDRKIRVEQAPGEKIENPEGTLLSVEADC